MTNLVKPTQKRRKLIVVAGHIVDNTIRIACDPYWVQWQAAQAHTGDYVPFQNVQPHECVCAEYREDHVGA